MTLSKLRSNSSFESVRKQAKKVVRLAAAADPEALARVRIQIAAPSFPLSLRDAQLVIAREYGFAGWQDLRKAVLRQEGKGLEWAAAEAEHAIHDNRVDKLSELLTEYPALLTWSGEAGESLLGFATGSFGDSGDPDRERMFTRIECAELLLDAGSPVDRSIWDGAIQARAKAVLQLLARKAAPPSDLKVLAALGDLPGVKARLAQSKDIDQALVAACRFEQREVAEILLQRCIELEPGLGKRVDEWRGRAAFIDYLIDHPDTYEPLWMTVVMNELLQAIGEGNVEEFARWLRREPALLGEAHISLQVQLIEHSSWNDRGPFISRLLELKPALLGAARKPRSSALEYALEYGNAHLIPLLTQIWPLPGDLAHAAGVGDFARVRAWFDDEGRPRLGSLGQQYPTNNPTILRHLRWSPPNVQQVLDVALAWSCINRHFDIATFLLERGANIDTDWATHEPAGILHECAVHGNYETAQFLIDHGIDLTRRDYRWNATAEGWAIYAANDQRMGEMLAQAARKREASS